MGHSVFSEIITRIGESVLVYINSITAYEIKQTLGLLVGTGLQYTYLKDKNNKVFVLILSSSIFISYFILSPLMTYYKVAADSLLRLPVISGSSFISTIILASGLHWLPDQLKKKVILLLGLQNNNNNEILQNSEYYPDVDEDIPNTMRSEKENEKDTGRNQ